MTDTPLMFDGEPLTKREVLIAREAFDKGYRANHDDFLRARMDNPNLIASWASYKSAQGARTAYPLPKITRPRVVKDTHPHGPEWCVINGTIWQRATDEGVFQPFMYYPMQKYTAPLPERVALWADLLAHPEEVVEDES